MFPTMKTLFVRAMERERLSWAGEAPPLTELPGERYPPFAGPLLSFRMPPGKQKQLRSAACTRILSRDTHRALRHPTRAPILTACSLRKA